MFQIKFSKTIICLLFLTLAFSVSAQMKRKAVKKKTANETTLTKTQPVAENDAIPVGKKNARPESESQTPPTEQTNDKVKTDAHPAAADGKSVYFYEFSESDFFISKIYIEHDDHGKGKITFQKKDFAEPVTDPIQLSAAALERIKITWQALNFLDSTENYQYEKDFSNLGTMKFTMKKNGRTRAATFNWTDNKDAKTLADEYRRVGQQFIWIFDVTVARENQPLEAPKLLDSLDSLIRRNEISDTVQMIPLLNELSNDERIPLIARNHATKLIKQIEKRKEGEK